jgi:hypothetical protein
LVLVGARLVLLLLLLSYFSLDVLVFTGRSAGASPHASCGFKLGL